MQEVNVTKQDDDQPQNRTAEPPHDQDPPDPQAGEGGGNDGDEDDDAGGEVTIKASELHQLKRQVSELRKDKRQRDAEAKKAADDAAQQKGEWEKLAKEREQELEREREQRRSYERRSRVAAAAGRHRFRDPEDVYGHLERTDADLDDDNSVEQALKALAKSKSYLLMEEDSDDGNNGQSRPRVQAPVRKPAAKPDDDETVDPTTRLTRAYERSQRQT